MPNAIAGATAIITNGNTTASARTRIALLRLIATSGEDSSMTGNSVHADMDQSDTSCTPAKGATTAGTTSPTQNATAASRRSGVVGQAMSLTAARVGRVTRNAITSGTAT